MNKAFVAYQQGKITRDEMYRYQELHKKLMGNDMFVEVDSYNPEWTEFNKLTGKILNKKQ